MDRKNWSWGGIATSMTKSNSLFRPRASLRKSLRRSGRGASVEVQRMTPEDACTTEMLVLIRGQGRTMAVPLAQRAAVNPDEPTAEAIGDWHYWVAQGYCF